MFKLEKNLIYNELGKLAADYIFNEEINFDKIVNFKSKKNFKIYNRYNFKRRII